MIGKNKDFKLFPAILNINNIPDVIFIRDLFYSNISK